MPSGGSCSGGSRRTFVDLPEIDVRAGHAPLQRSLGRGRRAVSMMIGSLPMDRKARTRARGSRRCASRTLRRRKARPPRRDAALSCRRGALRDRWPRVERRNLVERLARGTKGAAPIFRKPLRACPSLELCPPAGARRVEPPCRRRRAREEALAKRPLLMATAARSWLFKAKRSASSPRGAVEVLICTESPAEPGIFFRSSRVEPVHHAFVEPWGRATCSRHRRDDELPAVRS